MSSAVLIVGHHVATLTGDAADLVTRGTSGHGGALAGTMRFYAPRPRLLIVDEVGHLRLAGDQVKYVIERLYIREGLQAPLSIHVEPTPSKIAAR